MPLSMAEEGKKLKVVNIFGGQNLKQRLYALGIYPDVIVKVVTNGFNGPLIISVNNTKIAIGKGMANKVIVEPI